MILVLGIAAHVIAAFGLFWAIASVAHLVGVAEDPRIVEMAAWERAIILAWGLAALDWWWQWHRFRRGDW
jgi:hypothetical protein